MSQLLKQTVDEWLDQIDYKTLNDGHYVPSDFALKFVSFIKAVNGAQGESHKTPVFHLRMLDKVATKSQRIANLCSRGLAKTTLMFEYFILYLAVFGEIDGFGELDSMIYVSDSMENGVKSARKNIEFRYNSSEFLQKYLPPKKAKFTDNYIEFTNVEGRKFGVKMFGAKTGLRGTKIFGKRPKLAVLDDLVSDEDAKSRVAMAAINDTVYKGVNFALDPTRKKVIFNGTPFNKMDILYEAVESGAWDVNVWPICDRFPCEPHEFNGAWEDRFTYEYVKGEYESAVLTGKLAAFNQELMLRISSEEERLIQDSEINWYSRKSLLNNKEAFNFYITTDFATSSKQTADLTVISVWAYSSNGDWFWVDGIAKRQLMDQTMDDLFRLAQEYQPQSVGIEVTGQQGGFIPLIQREMVNKGIFFNLARDKNSPGIRPTTDKLSRFNMVVPWFKAGKMYFPTELKTTEVMGHFMSQLSLATINGLKGKDDCIDTISMLGALKVWKPAATAGIKKSSDGIYDLDHYETSNSSLQSYIV
nr:MAG: terminase large subunit [Caudoviricetes sp.]